MAQHFYIKLIYDVVTSISLNSQKVGDFMESIVWINGTYEEDNRIFDSRR